MGGRRIETCVARRHVDASRDCYFIFPERAAWGGRGCGAIIFILFSFPCSADHGRDWPPKGGSYGNKILYKNLKFFDKIFVRKSCRRRFRNAPYGEKILLMGKSYVWA